MLKQFLYLILLSLVVVLAMPYCSTGLQWLLSLHALIIDGLNNIFTQGQTAVLIKNLLALLIIPVGAGIIIGGIYWGFKRSNAPWLMQITWVIWIILATALVINQ